MNCCCTNFIIMKLSINYWFYIIYKEKRCFLNILIKISCNFVYIIMCDICIYWFFLYILYSKFFLIYLKYKVNRKWVFIWWFLLFDVLLFCWFFFRRDEILCFRVFRVWSCGFFFLKYICKLFSEFFIIWRLFILFYKKNIIS